jgi:hypothetical protein
MPAQLFESASKGVGFDGVHGRAVAYEEDRHFHSRRVVGHETGDSRRNLEYIRCSVTSPGASNSNRVDARFAAPSPK